MVSYQPQPSGASAGTAIPRLAVLRHRFRRCCQAGVQEVRDVHWPRQSQRPLVVGAVHLHRIPRARPAGVRRRTATSRDGGRTPGLLALPLIILFAVFLLGILIPTLALTVRRLHDAGYSGLLALLFLVPYLGGLIIMIFALLPSSPAGAKYDPIPTTTAPYNPYPTETPDTQQGP